MFLTSILSRPAPAGHMDTTVKPTILSFGESYKYLVRRRSTRTFKHVRLVKAKLISPQQLTFHTLFQRQQKKNKQINTQALLSNHSPTFSLAYSFFVCLSHTCSGCTDAHHHSAHWQIIQSQSAHQELSSVKALVLTMLGYREKNTLFPRGSR